MREASLGTPVTPPALWQLVLWFGVLAGLGEATLLILAMHYRNAYVHLDVMMVWMAPLGNTVLFGVLALVPALAGLRREAFRGLPVRAGYLAFFAFLGGLLIYQRLHLWSAGLLALGLAMTLSRLVRAAPRLSSRVVRYTALPLGAVVVLLAVLERGREARVERAHLAALPAAAAGQPNVLLLILDTVRSWSLSVYGYPRPTTPQLERWAGRGVLFRRAFSTASWTLPSHATMFTGHRPDDLPAGWTRPMSRKYPTLAEALAGRGYRTAGFVANIFFATRESGLARGFSRYEDWPVSAGTVLRFTSIGRTLDKSRGFRTAVGWHELLGRKSAEEVNRDFLRWLPRDTTRPFFAFLNYIDAHGPYLPPAPFAGRFGGTPERNNVLLDERQAMSEADFDDARNAYDEAVAYLDHQVGALLDSLEHRGQLDNTIVVITSDHGEEFGEHGYLEHGYTLYRASVEVPLIVVAPGRAPAGMTVRTPVSLRHLPATIMDLVGGPGGRFPGGSLARLWQDPAAADRPTADTLMAELDFSRGRPPNFISSLGEIHSLIIGDRRYIRTGKGVQEELYDFVHDTMETRNLADTPEGRALLPGFRTALDHLLTSRDTIRPASPGTP